MDKASKTTLFQILLVLYMSGIQQFKTSIARPMFRFCVIAQPIVFGLLLGMMYLKRSPEDFMLYAVLGSGLSAFWSSICFSSASDVHREKWYGTLENLFAAPIGFKWIILGKIIGNSVWGFLSVVLSVAVVSIGFQKPLIIASPLWLCIGLLIMTISLVAIAYLFAGLFTLSRNARVLMNFMEHPVYILCGILFPVELLPKALQVVSYMLSPTWAVKILQFAVRGGSVSEVLPYVAGLSVLTIIYATGAIVLFEQIDKKVRIHATLEVF